MSEVSPNNDGEIDLFEIFETLWDGKWVLVAFVAVSIVVGFGYGQLTKPAKSIYTVSISYTPNLYSVSAQQICAGGLSGVCGDQEVKKRLMAHVEKGWVKADKISKLSLIVESPLKAQQYTEAFERHNKSLTTEMYNEANAELEFIKTKLNSSFLSTERVATSTLNAMRIVQAIDNGQQAISFGSVSITKFTRKKASVIIIPTVLGGVFGMFFLIVRNTYRKRKEKLAKG